MEHQISQGEDPFSSPQATLERVPGIMVVRMVLHIVKFVNGFPRRGASSTTPLVKL